MIIDSHAHIGKVLKFDLTFKKNLSEEDSENVLWKNSKSIFEFD